MKRWIVLQVLIVVVALIIGQSLKTTFTDAGLLDIKSTEEAFTLEHGLDYVFGEDTYESFVDYQSTYLDSVKSASLIVVAKPTGNMTQKHFSLGQEIKIEKVIKGSSDIVNTSAFVYGTYGFAIREEHTKPLYYSTKNLMKPDHQYLVFLSGLELNDYTEEDSYLLVDSFFSYLDLTSDSNEITNIPLENLKFSDLKDLEFFASSQKVLNEILKIKQQIIEDNGSAKND